MIISANMIFAISNDEYEEAVQLALDMGFDLQSGPFKHLKNLRS